MIFYPYSAFHIQHSKKMLSKKQIILKIAKDGIKVLIAAGIALAAVWFFSREITRISNSMAEKTALTSLMESRNDIILKLKNDLEPIGNKKVKIEQALPPADNILEFIGALESLAAKHSLTQNIKFSSPIPLAAVAGESLNFYSIDYNLTLNGSVSTLILYLKDFERLPYFSGVNSFTLNAQAPNTWSDNSVISIQAKLYVK